eukprot:9099305-Pyramimonas_sp.AAC.4
MIPLPAGHRCTRIDEFASPKEFSCPGGVLKRFPDLEPDCIHLPNQDGAAYVTSHRASASAPLLSLLSPAGLRNLERPRPSAAPATTR